MRRLALAGIAVAVAAIAVAWVLGLRGNVGTAPGDTEANEQPEGEAERREDRSAEAPGLAARARRGKVVRNEAGPPAEAREVLHGVVLTPHGRPVSQANVNLYREVSDSKERATLMQVGSTRTDSEGAFRCRVRPAGTRGATASPDFWMQVDGRPSASLVALRTTVGESGTRVVLPAMRSVTVRVLDPDESPVGRIHVRVVAPGSVTDPPPPAQQTPGSDWTSYLEWDTRAATGYTTATGEVRFRIAEGALVASAFPLRETGLLVPSPIAFDADVVAVRLERGSTVSGIVTDAAGVPVPDAVVWWRTSDGKFDRQRAGADGSYSIPGLPKGTVELWGDAFGHGSSPDVTPLVAATDRTDANVIVDLGRELHVRVENWPAGAEGTAMLRNRAAMYSRSAVPPARVSAAGEAILRRVHPRQSYTLQVNTEDGTQTLTRPGVTADATPLVVRLSPTGSLRIVLDSDVAFFVSKVVVADVDTMWSDESEGPPKEIRLDGLPSGPIKFSVTARGPVRTDLHATAEAEVPGRVRVQLR